MNPEITVIVPYHNEKKTIEYTLERVGQQTLPAKMALFVNSSSTDDTFEVIDLWIKKNQCRFSTQFQNFFENTDNPASSKNVGIRRAETEWLAFMDCGQLFEKTWLENQMSFISSHNLEVASGVVHLTGVNWIDRCAVAQTYGYKRNRACVPTTLIRKSVFDRTGLFAENRRAGYDAAWQGKLKGLGIKRGVNERVVIRYEGANFSDNLSHLVTKTVLYSRYSVGLEGYPMPYYHLAGLFILLSVCVYSPKVAVAVLLPCYFLARGAILPAIKSRNASLFKEHPLEAVLCLPFIGILIDIAKSTGYLRGAFSRLIYQHQ